MMQAIPLSIPLCAAAPPLSASSPSLLIMLPSNGAAPRVVAPAARPLAAVALRGAAAPSSVAPMALEPRQQQQMDMARRVDQICVKSEGYIAEEGARATAAAQASSRRAQLWLLAGHETRLGAEPQSR
jgi:hypothetical protein